MNIYHTPAKTPLYQDLYQKLRNKIESGEFPVGYKLPSEKQIAEENGVSRITSKHALDQLVREGFINRFPGKGSFVQSQFGTMQAEAVSVSVESAALSSRLIGVLMEDIGPHFGGGLLMGIERMCAEAGYNIVLKFSYGEEKREIACVQELLETGVCGILVMCCYSEVYSPTIMKLSLDGFPMIFLDRTLRGLPVPYVGIDHKAAAKQLTCEMIARGHEHLALAMIEGSHTTSSVEDRIQGYVEGCLDHNLPCANKRIFLQRENHPRPDPRTRQTNIRRIHEFLKENPETRGILALTCSIAEALLPALDNGASSDYTVSSFDGPMNLREVPCGLFYVKQDQELIGRTACKQLIDMISGKEPQQQTYVPYNIIEYPRTKKK